MSTVADLLEIQRGAGAPITIDGSRITVMARGGLRADIATTKRTPSLTSEIIATGPASDKAPG